ncbi:CaiB/BaiF CoA transferase family protein [Bradyrhizobium liaoningense]|uniref:CaiB/BaiF CoA transferase family protein n=1 Tax=Bradyrhizobium liaoningense TaxID=43992 RepID=UPI001BA7C49D|nr:CaiB/BaiF CoA-transferase family protein [Bradyrhizobium liaoningense]MBR0859181.1 CoA transferase [Bradyrhizobium liaoningense]
MGPLSGLKIVELAGIGPAPMCGMLLADLGASILRVDRLEPSGLGVERPIEFNLIMRNRDTVALDLKSKPAIELVLRLVRQADVLIEGFRPGVTERLGLGPTECMARNPALVYGRVTGWGQGGPLAKYAGHDLNYVAITGALAAMGRAGAPPTPPLNVVGDFAGGGLFLAFGILAAVVEARNSGKGQVVDAGIVDGVSSMMTQFFGMKAAGLWTEKRGDNILDSGAPFYDVYQCADGQFISVAPIEDKFFLELVRLIGLPSSTIELKKDKRRWGELRAVLTDIFAKRSSQYWRSLLENTDACFAPVLTMEEAGSHPQLKARKTLIEVAGVVQPAPAPRFSRSVPDVPRPPRAHDPKDYKEILSRWLPREELASALEMIAVTSKRAIEAAK